MCDDSPSRSATKKSASSALKAASRAPAGAPSAVCITARRRQRLAAGTTPQIGRSSAKTAPALAAGLLLSLSYFSKLGGGLSATTPCDTRVHVGFRTAYSYAPIHPCLRGLRMRLVGLLRHPLFHCQRQDDLQRGRPVTGIMPRGINTSTCCRAGGQKFGLATITSKKDVSQRAFFFDLGASVYQVESQESSLRWFHETYRQRGIHFDRIFAWEAKPYPTAKVFPSSMPDEVLDSLSYFNYPLEATPRATRNPWRTLVAVTRPEDFVVIKIDFDVAVEGELVEQILRDSALSALVDELYFEQHHEQHTFDSPHTQSTIWPRPCERIKGTLPIRTTSSLGCAEQASGRTVGSRCSINIHVRRASGDPGKS